MGGVWTSGKDSLQPLVWQIEWPPEVRTQIHSTSNPDCNIYINDLELAGTMLGWIILEWDQHSITNKHISMFCDNTSTVNWAAKLCTSKSIAAARLL
eukprot:4346368-Ditylum_brightwellii.AAC.1